METKSQEIRVYVTPDGQCPFNVWFGRLKDSRAKVKIDVRIERLAQGNWGDCKNVRGGVYELRIDFGPGYRVYFGKAGTDLILLLCGGDKSSQQRDIAEARAYWDDYKEGDYGGQIR